MEKPSQKDMREDVLFLLKSNPKSAYTINEMIAELAYEESWRPTIAKVVSELKGRGMVMGEKDEGDLAMSYSLNPGYADIEINIPDEPKPESIRLAGQSHEYHLSKVAETEGEFILLHEGVGTLQGAINMAETLAKQEMCDIIIERIETVTVGTVKTTIQTQFQPVQP